MTEDQPSPLPLASPTAVIGQQWLLGVEEEYRHHPASTGDNHKTPQHQWVFVLPVLLLEFLAIGLTRAVLPSILLQEYGSKVYLVLGSADCIRGLLAFFACPLFGKLSDLWGRKQCLLITVLGSCAPVCSLALFSWHATMVLVQENGEEEIDLSALDESLYRNGTLHLPEGVTTKVHYTMPPSAIPLFVMLLSLSGIFSSTFTLIFAYISDTVETRNERVSAFGLALA